jgi:hypothetical protein
MKLVRPIKTYTEGSTGICLIIFSIQFGLKQGDDLIPLFFSIFALEYVNGNVKGNEVGLELSGTHRLLAYADNLNLLGDNIDTVKKNTETLTDVSKEVGLRESV